VVEICGLVGEDSKGGRKKDVFVSTRVEQVLPYFRFKNSTSNMGMVEDNSDNRMGFTIMKTGERELRLPRTTDHGRMLTALPNQDSAKYLQSRELQ
jgi:hypothetical protein